MIMLKRGVLRIKAAWREINYNSAVDSNHLIDDILDLSGRSYTHTHTHTHTHTSQGVILSGIVTLVLDLMTLICFSLPMSFHTVHMMLIMINVIEWEEEPCTTWGHAQVKQPHSSFSDREDKILAERVPSSRHSRQITNVYIQNSSLVLKGSLHICYQVRGFHCHVLMMSCKWGTY